MEVKITLTGSSSRDLESWSSLSSTKETDAQVIKDWTLFRSSATD